MIRKGQVQNIGGDDMQAQTAFVARLFKVAASLGQAQGRPAGRLTRAILLARATITSIAGLRASIPPSPRAGRGAVGEAA
jgi:hypothetical protein